MWQIFRSPRDFPGKYVVRRWLVPGGPDRCVAAVVDTLAAARRAIPPGLTVVPRQAADDLVIVETWF